MGVTKDEMIGILVCVDCIHLIANGECDPDRQESVSEAMARLWDGFHLGCGNVDCEEDHSDGDCACEEPHFSTSSCDGCGSYLHGDRHPAFAVKL